MLSYIDAKPPQLGYLPGSDGARARAALPVTPPRCRATLS